jgi:dTDP-glucose pyrophosphorylase
MPVLKMMDKAVILARGLGTRMRKQDEQARMSEQQEAIAQTGLKAMIPIDRPFLDYVLHALAEAGYRRICLIIGPEHDVVREYYGRKIQCQRLRIDFAVQEMPLGTADAVRAAADFARDDHFLTINSDNYYPIEAMRALRELDECGLTGFDRDAMLGGNIPADRISKFAVIQIDAAGYMAGILEKPDEQTLAKLPRPISLSMNCWRFGPAIFEACRNITPSPRGEYELPDAVKYTMEHLGERYKVLPCRQPVLDMSYRGDIESIASKLAGTEVLL